MKLGYSEFSYGYAFTENLIRSSATGPATAPVFPNLVQEATLGYDVFVDLPGVPLYFQFKLPTLLTRSNAREIQLGLTGLSLNLFRMPLMLRDKSDQHKNLMALEAKFPKAVFYTSPEMETVDDFNAAYVAAIVPGHSAFFSPRAIGPLPDDKEHCVSYCQSSAIAWRCSEPKKLRKFKLVDVMATATNELDKRQRQPLEQTVKRLREQLNPLLPAGLLSAEQEIRNLVEARGGTGTERLAPDERTRAVSIDLIVAKELARVGLGVEMLIAQPRPSPTPE